MISIDTNESPWIVTLQMNNTSVKFHLDTEAEITVINDSVHKKVNQRDQALCGPRNQSLTVKEKQVQFGGITTEQNCYVVTDLSRPLLRYPAIEQLNLLARVQTV